MLVEPKQHYVVCTMLNLNAFISLISLNCTGNTENKPFFVCSRISDFKNNDCYFKKETSGSLPRLHIRMEKNYLEISIHTFYSLFVFLKINE